jgi:hypothetical protein
VSASLYIGIGLGLAWLASRRRGPMRPPPPPPGGAGGGLLTAKAPTDYAPHIPDTPIDFEDRRCHPLYWQPGVVVYRPNTIVGGKLGGGPDFQFEFHPGENAEWIEQFNRDVVQVAARIPLSDLRSEDFTLAWLLITQQLVPRPDYQQKVSLERFEAFMNEVKITEEIVHAVLSTVASLVGVGGALDSLEKVFGADLKSLEAGNQRFESAFTQGLLQAGQPASSVPVAIARYLTHADDVAVFNGSMGEFVFDANGGLLGGGHWEGRTMGWPPGTVNVDQNPNPYKVTSLAGAMFNAAMPGTWHWEGAVEDGSKRMVSNSPYGVRARRAGVAFVPRGRLFLSRCDQNPNNGEAISQSPWDLPWWNTSMVNPMSLKYTAITFARIYRALDVMACGYASFKPKPYNWLDTTTTGNQDPNVPPLYFYKSKLGTMLGSIFPPTAEDIDLAPREAFLGERVTVGQAAAGASGLVTTTAEPVRQVLLEPTPTTEPTPTQPELGISLPEPEPTKTDYTVSRLLVTWT